MNAQAAVAAHRSLPKPPMSEAALQSAVTDALDWARWLWHHETDSRRTRPGWPDLVATHHQSGRLLIAELKADKGRLTAEQERWIDALSIAMEGQPRACVGVLRPDRLDDVLDWIASQRGEVPTLPLR